MGMKAPHLAGDRLSAADRQDRHAFGIEVAPTPLRERLKRELIAHALDQNDAHAASSRISSTVRRAFAANSGNVSV
jgi:hypothetical protein